MDDLIYSQTPDLKFQTSSYVIYTKGQHTVHYAWTGHLILALKLVRNVSLLQLMKEHQQKNLHT